MQRLKRILLPMQGQSKSHLHWLYNTSSRNEDEEEKVFTYGELRFSFAGTGHRNTERLMLMVHIPSKFLWEEKPVDTLPYEDYLLRRLAPELNELSREYYNADKNVREKAQFEAQQVNEHVLRRSGLYYDAPKGAFLLRILFYVPLLNAVSVNGKAAFRAIRDIMEHVERRLQTLDATELRRCVQLYERQCEIRSYLKMHGYCAFVADGSILPRENGTNQPKTQAIPFQSPKESAITIPLADGECISGMGVKQGITVITGGGYSGKSTLLDALEMGIYNHAYGDGREYVLTEASALKVYTEDGRPVSELNLSPFFQYLPGAADLESFTTRHASGSVSQAANVIEAVMGGAKVLLMDEDKSATNFMIRDHRMRQLVTKEPIIPFTDRVTELYEEKGVSTILVIGGSSEYLAYADTVLLMEDYTARDVTGQIQELGLVASERERMPISWMSEHFLIPKETTQSFLYFRTVETENEKKIILDDYSADITLLTALTSGNQLNTLAFLMEMLLTDKNADSAELLEKIETCWSRLFGGIFDAEMHSGVLIDTHGFLEEIRPLDAFCCVNRMRGVRFQVGKE